MKEVTELSFLATAKVIPRADSILLFGGSKVTFEHIASNYIGVRIEIVMQVHWPAE